MHEDFTEEEMRQALFGNAEKRTQATTPAVLDASTSMPPKPQTERKLAKSFTPRLKVVLRVGNEFEGETCEFVYEANTLSTLLAEQEAMKAARRKYKFIEVVSVKSM